MRVPIENNGLMPLYVAGVMIPPGETRHFDDDQLPPEFRQAAPAASADVPLDPLMEIVAMKVDEIAKGLADLSGDELDRLEMLEAEGKNRKGVIAAVVEERLRRADSQAGGEGGEG